MSKQEILAELPKLAPSDRREIFDRLCEMEEHEALDPQIAAQERALLDQELAEYRQEPSAGSPWAEVRDRVRRPVSP